MNPLNILFGIGERPKHSRNTENSIPLWNPSMSKSSLPKHLMREPVSTELDMLRQLNEQTAFGVLHWRLIESTRGSWFVSEPRAGRVVRIADEAPLCTPRLQVLEEATHELLVEYTGPFNEKLGAKLRTLLKSVREAHAQRSRHGMSSQLHSFVTGSTTRSPVSTAHETKNTECRCRCQERRDARARD